MTTKPDGTQRVARAALRRLGIKPAALAARIGVQRSTVTRWLNGTRRMSPLARNTVEALK